MTIKPPKAQPFLLSGSYQIGCGVLTVNNAEPQKTTSGDSTGAVEFNKSVTVKAIGFITEKSKIQMLDEDHRVARFLRQNDVVVFPMPWDEFDPIAFSKLDMAIFRTPWNYLADLPKFLEWLKVLGGLKVPLHNPLPIVYWNLDKHYLRELAAKGVPTVPTLYFKTQDFSLSLEWPTSPTDYYVLKPVVSASARKTFKGDRLFLTDILTEESFYQPSEGLMLQPFVESVVTEGEYSFVFFNGEFSHALIKKPKANDFRVQIEHGGSWDLITPTSSQLGQAQSALKTLDHTPLYARVDMVRIDKTLHLMELELFEPMLYIKTDEHAANFGRAILARLAGR